MLETERRGDLLVAHSLPIMQHHGLAQLRGQLLPGLSLVLTPAEAPVPQLPVLTFPGNLGEAQTLRQAWALMQAG